MKLFVSPIFQTASSLWLLQKKSVTAVVLIIVMSSRMFVEAQYDYGNNEAPAPTSWGAPAPTTSFWNPPAPTTSSPTEYPTSSPTPSPTSAPSPSPTSGAPVALDVANNGALVCSFRNVHTVANSNNEVTLRQYINQAASTVTVELTYAGIGWIGTAFKTDRSMVPSIAIIGLPETNTVEKYNLAAQALTGVTPITNEAQLASLSSTSIAQNETHTVLTFTRPLVEDASFGETDVSATEENVFIWAVGSSNALNYHKARGSDSLVFDQCLEKGETDSPVAPAEPSTDAPGPDASGRLTNIQLLGEDLVLSLFPDPATQALTVELTYAGLGWIGFGFSKDGSMVGSDAVLGGIDNTIAKYNLDGKSVSAVVKAPANQQATLTNTEFTQNDTHTFMKFTKPLVEENEIPITLTGENIFLFAVGSDNILSQHTARGTITLSLEQNATGGGSVDSFVPNENLWKAHGICMGVAWGIFVPLAIGCSLCRKLIPGDGIWFQLHRGFNTMAVLLTIVGFSIAVHTYNKQGDKHFSITHGKLGLSIFIFALGQLSNGILRPHLPSTATGDDKEGGDAETPSGASPIAPEKSKPRIIWEWGHRLLGGVILLLAYVNLNSGAEEYESSYQDDPSTLIYAIAGSVLGLVVLATIYAKVKA